MDLVPFNTNWSDSGTKLDLKAIYRRGSGTSTSYAALPVRRHNDWTHKGFSYVTLATAEDVVAVRSELKNRGVDLNALAKSYDTTAAGAFKMVDYLAEQRAADKTKVADIQAKVDKFGTEAVLEMMRAHDPGWTMPEGIKPAKGKA